MIGTLSLVGAGLGVTIVPQSLTMVRMDNVVFREIAVPRSGYAHLNLVALKRADEAAITAFREIVANLLRDSS
jgi:DNA-binding transcriptional LysR family regulator